MSDGNATTEKVTLDQFLASMKLKTEDAGGAKPIFDGSLEKVREEKDVKEVDRFLTSLAALVLNVDPNFGLVEAGVADAEGRLEKADILELIGQINGKIEKQVNEILHTKEFQALESAWRGLDDLVQNTNFKANIAIDMIDVGKDELFDDFENNAVDITGSALFQKVYVAEYDQYGGRPFGAMIGLYEFDHTPDDLFFLQTAGKIANASHAPFVASASPKFFGCETIEEAGNIRDLEGLLNHPRYGDWQRLRNSEEAAYLGLCFPRYVLRLPYDPDNNPCRRLKFFKEAVNPLNNNDFLWGNAAVLFARNMARSFETSGWCQYLRGPKAGGLISGLPCYTFNVRGEDETKIPVELSIPDYRELEFANSGFMPLVYRKGTSDACFFSVQSTKATKRFKDPKDSENSQLVANMSYTMSITRIAHYVKSIMRDNIGSTADASYIQESLQSWLNQYVTTVSNPDDLTLRYYPFKAVNVQVQERPGSIGMYDCQIAVLPHIQFEGMDVELRLESRLG